MNWEEIKEAITLIKSLAQFKLKPNWKAMEWTSWASKETKGHEVLIKFRPLAVQQSSNSIQNKSSQRTSWTNLKRGQKEFQLNFPVQIRFFIYVIIYCAAVAVAIVRRFIDVNKHHSRDRIFYDLTSGVWQFFVVPFSPSRLVRSQLR